MLPIEVCIGFFGPQNLLDQQVIGRGNIVVPVCLDALDCVVGVEAVVVEEARIDLIVHGHQLFAGEETWGAFVARLAKPRMVSDLLDCVPFGGLCN